MSRLLTFSNLAPSAWAASVQGVLATSGETWPAILATSASDVDWPLMGKLAGGLIFFLTTYSLVLNIIKQHKAPQPQQVAQPIKIENVKEFVTQPHLERELSMVLERVEKVETTVNDVLVNPDGYLHNSVHEVRDALQEVVSSADLRDARMMDRIAELANKNSQQFARAHDRIDAVAANVSVVQETVGKVQGGVEASNATLSEINKLLLAKALNPTRGGRAS